MYLKRDPGPCPVDDAPHTTCVAPASAGAILIVHMPMRDGVVTPPLVGTMTPPANVGALQPPASAPPLLADKVQARLPVDHFTTGTYRRKRKE